MSLGSGSATSRAGAAAGILALPLLLSGCGLFSGTTALTGGAAPCPRVAILGEGADLTRFRAGGARDLTAQTLDARIAGFQVRCDFAGSSRQAVEIRLTPRFEAGRGPAAEGRTADLPWFVALTDSEDTTVVARVSETTRVTFAANVQRAEATGRPVRVTMPLGERRAADYMLRLSFQLTPEELALNRQRGPR